MFQGKLIDLTAQELIKVLPHGVCRTALKWGYDCYGIDSGLTLLILFTTYFQESFLRQFFVGTDQEFQQALENLKSHKIYFPVS